jgi:3-oxoacyl-[acyl-carrier protein] reductase
VTSAHNAWEQPLIGQVAVVTGAGRGIGRAIAQAYFRAGADVAVVDVNVDSTMATVESFGEHAGLRGLPIVADVSQRASVEELIERTSRHFGRLDVLVNNAGIVHESPNFLEVTDAEWQFTLDTNLTGTFLCSQMAGRVMAAARGGVIVNMTSIGAMRPSPGGAAYQASKGGIISLTRAMAVNLAPYGIRVNAIAPGVIQTAMTPAANVDGEAQARLLARIPSDRLGQPEDVAGAAVFLASPAAAYISGQVLVVDGGAMILGHAKATRGMGDK